MCLKKLGCTVLTKRKMMHVFFQLNVLNAKSFPYNNDKPLLTLIRVGKIIDKNHGSIIGGKVNWQIRSLSAPFFAKGQSVKYF